MRASQSGVGHWRIAYYYLFCVMCFTNFFLLFAPFSPWFADFVDLSCLHIRMFVFVSYFFRLLVSSRSRRAVLCFITFVHSSGLLTGCSASAFSEAALSHAFCSLYRIVYLNFWVCLHYFLILVIILVFILASFTFARTHCSGFFFCLLHF